MIQITFPNGAKYNLTGLVIRGKYIDSDGTPAPGECPIAYTESDVGRLNSIVPLQSLFAAFTAPSEESESPADAQENAQPETSAEG